jgi:hypothetical protein
MYTGNSSILGCFSLFLEPAMTVPAKPLVAVRFSADELAELARAAESEFLPLATYAKRAVMQYVRGAHPVHAQFITPTSTQQPAETPKGRPHHIPKGPSSAAAVVHREALLVAAEGGAPIKLLAQDNDMDVPTLQQKLSQARKARADGTLAAAQAKDAFVSANPNPDPDNLCLHVWNMPTGTEFEWGPKPTTPAASEPYREPTEAENRAEARRLIAEIEATNLPTLPSHMSLAKNKPLDPDAAARLDDLFS